MSSMNYIAGDANNSGHEMVNNDHSSVVNPAIQEQHLQFQQQLIQLKQQQQLQQQLLLQHFQQQQQQLAEQHEKQLQERIRVRIVAPPMSPMSFINIIIRSDLDRSLRSKTE